MNPTVRAFRQVQFAINLAGVAHNKQLDKAGEPYLWHVLRVGIGLLPDVDACLLGILHDVLEDYTCPRDALLTALGDVELYQDLLALTRHESETYDHYIARIQTRPRAIIVKLADLIDNLNLQRYGAALANGADPAKMAALRRRYARAYGILSSGKPAPNEVTEA